MEQVCEKAGSYWEPGNEWASSWRCSFFPLVAVWLTYNIDSDLKRFLPFVISGIVLWAVVMFTLKGRRRF
ncbi:MAG: hypothetical protein FJ319_00290 [SAR202 cluster bacterium]|nr:hypothetical protein [SAR202 cluster bacterium]